MPWPPRSWSTSFLAAAEALVVAACYLAAIWYSVEVDPSIFLLYEGGLVSVLVTAFVFVAAMHFQMLYAHAPRMRSRMELAVALATVVGIAFLAQAAMQYLWPGFGLPLNMTLAGSGLAFVCLFAWRLAYLKVTAGVLGVQRVLLFGATPLMREIGRRIAARPACGFTVAGYLDQEFEPGTPLEGGKVLGPFSALPELWQAVRPDCVVADPAGIERQVSPEIIRRATAVGVVVERPTSLYEKLFTRVPVASASPAALFFGEKKPAAARVAAQSVYNNLIALAVLLLLGPAMLLLAVLIRIGARGPVLAGQSTMGWELLPFTLYRFRTGGTHWMKRLRLDGLPQFLSVLRGEMSLVGPRPVAVARANELMETLPAYRLRFAVKPGLLSLADIKAAPGSLDVTTELEYDLYYARHVSIALDSHVLLHSIRFWLGEGRKSRVRGRPGGRPL
jgi:lipopolysaccharide/colanic/teichoic acid biosynthesis glycosyltransferase